MAESSSKNQTRILVTEDDGDIRNLIVELLRAKNFAVDEASNGDEAWEKIQEQDYDALLLDWKFDGKLSALALINRIKQKPAYEFVPILVISGYLNTKEMRYLMEVMLAETIGKPVRGDQVDRKLQLLLRERSWHLKQRDHLVEAMSRIKNAADIEASEQVKRIIDASPRPVPLFLMAGAYLRRRKNFALALDFLNAAREMDAESPLILGEIGRVYLEMGNISDAKRFLESAQQQSPDNVSRLCDLGHISLQDNNLISAREYFKLAAAIDSSHELVKSSEALTANIEAFLADHDASEVPTSYAGLLNAIGISLVQDRKFTKGLQHYQLALQYLRKNSLKAKLAFNLGLGYLRWRKLAEAREWLQLALQFDGDYFKARELLERLGLRQGEAATTARRQLAGIKQIGESQPAAADDDDPLSALDLAKEADLLPAIVTKPTVSPPDDATAKKLEVLVDMVPDVKDLLANCVADGLYFPREVVILTNILETFGPRVLEEAIIHSLNHRLYSASAIMHYVEHNYRAAADTDTDDLTG